MNSRNEIGFRKRFFSVQKQILIVRQDGYFYTLEVSRMADAAGMVYSSKFGKFKIRAIITCEYHNSQTGISSGLNNKLFFSFLVI